MNIVQQPEALSLSGNILPFILSTTKSFSFTLNKDGSAIFSQTYNPGSTGLVTVKVRDAVEQQLSFTLNAATAPYFQDSIYGSFSAVITDSDGTTSVNFVAIRCGVDNLADTPSTFLKTHFLTWQPIQKYVTYYTPEYLTYYAIDTCTVKIKATFEGSIQETKTLCDIAAGKAITLALQYGVVYALFGKLPAFYNVWIEDVNGNRLTYIQRYVADNARSENEQWVMFENSLGGIDTFRAYGSEEFTGEHTHNVAEIDEVSLEYRVDTTSKHKKYTGHLTLDERQWLQDFFPSLVKYMYYSNAIRKIVTVESEDTYNSVDTAGGFSFTYKYADAGEKAYLNLSRNTSLPANINVKVPDLGNFTLPPRLVDFPAQGIDEGVLFPVQSPFDEKWGRMTFGAMYEYISSHVITALQGEMGASALSECKDILLTNLADNDGLFFDKESGKWKNKQLNISSIDKYDKIFTVTGSGADADPYILKINGNAYTTGGLAALGQGANGIGGGGVSALADCMDIAFTVLTDGDLLYYDKTSSHWKNRAADYYAKKSELNISNWDMAYSWGNHANAGYLQTETDPIFTASAAHGITALDILNWGNAYSNMHTHSNKSTLDGINDSFVSQWNSAYGWGNHASAGYAKANDLNTFILNFNKFFTLTGSGTDADPYIVKINGNAYATGGLAALGQGSNGTGGGVSALADCTDIAFTTLADGDVLYYDKTSSHWKNRVDGYYAKNSDLNIANWNTAYGWGNHAAAGYALSSTLGNYLPLAGGNMTGKLEIRKDLGGNNASDLQHTTQFEIMKSSDLKSMAFGVLDNGIGFIQAKESGVGYQALLLNPVSGNVGINLGGGGTPQYNLDVGGSVNANTYYSSSWFRSFGNSGWYNETYAGGLYMIDSAWLRTYGNNVGFWANGIIRSDSGFLGNLTGTATSLANFYSLSSASPIDANTVSTNGLYYYTANGPTGMTTSDGGLYVQNYSPAWGGQIAQDYRNGRLAIRGRNDNTWSTWLHILDEGNYSTYITSVSRSEYIGNDAQYMRFHWNGQSGQPSWLWGGNDAGNMYVYDPSNFSVRVAGYLPPKYIGGDQPNPQTYFGQGIGLKVAMTESASSPTGDWMDTLWINGYAGGDVLSMCALHFMRNGNPDMYISSQQDTSTTYGTKYRVLSTWNYASYALPLSGGTLTGEVYGTTIHLNNWIRTQGNCGWYNETYAGGWYMEDATWIRTWNNKSVYVNGDIIATGGVTALSDMRYKTVLRKQNIKLTDIASAPLFDFTLKIGNNKKTRIGTSAQYWKKILPQVIVKNDNMLSMDYASTALACCISMAREITKLQAKLQAKLDKYELR